MRRACALPFAGINRQKQRSPAGGHWAEGTVQQIEKSRHGETSILGATAKRVKLRGTLFALGRLFGWHAPVASRSPLPLKFTELFERRALRRHFLGSPAAARSEPDLRNSPPWCAGWVRGNDNTRRGLPDLQRQKRFPRRVAW